MTRASDTARLLSGGAVINEDSNDVDFRVEGNGDTHALFVQGGSDHVGINNNSPNSSFTGADNLVIGGGSGNTGMTILSGTSSTSSIEFSDGTSSDAEKTAGSIRYYHDSNYMRFNTGGGTERIRINSSGTLLVAQTAENTNVVGHGFFADGFAFHTRSGGQVLAINRLSDDGALISLRQGNNEEGTISSSGSLLTSMSLMFPLYSVSSGFQWACQLETSPISIGLIKSESLLTTHSIMSNLAGFVLSLSKGGYLIEIFDNVMISRKDK